MKLSGKQIGEIQEALLDAYSDRDILRMMVRVELDERLEDIAGGSNQRVVIFNLVSWAERTGRIDDLVQGAYRQNQGNPTLQKFLALWRTTAPLAVDQVASSIAPSERVYSIDDVPLGGKLSEELLKILVCPEDKGSLELVDEGKFLLNSRNGYKYPIRNGIPIMLLEEGKKYRDPNFAPKTDGTTA